MIFMHIGDYIINPNHIVLITVAPQTLTVRMVTGDVLTFEGEDALRFVEVMESARL